MRAEEWLPTGDNLSRHRSHRGRTVAQNGLGALYSAGDGVPEDRLEADLWSARAAEQGDPEGRHMADESVLFCDSGEL